MMGSSAGPGNRMEEKFTRQDRFVERLRGFTTDTGAHLTLVVHPRKVDDDHLLTINSLYGGGKISQEADNVMLLQEEIGTALPKKYIQVVNYLVIGLITMTSVTLSPSFRIDSEEQIRWNRGENGPTFQSRENVFQTIIAHTGSGSCFSIGSRRLRFVCT